MKETGKNRNAWLPERLLINGSTRRPAPGRMHPGGGFALDTLFLAVAIIAVNLAIIRLSVLAGFFASLILLPAVMISVRFARRLQRIGQRLDFVTKISVLALSIAVTFGMYLAIIAAIAATGWLAVHLCMLNGLADSPSEIVGLALALPAGLLTGLAYGYWLERLQRRYLERWKVHQAVARSWLPDRHANAQD